MSALPDIAQPDVTQTEVTLQTLRHRYQAVRDHSVALAAPLSAEDMTVQTMADVSPTKWHLAHTTWFFENFILHPHAKGYRRFNERYGYLFNSYYYTVGQMHPRPQRGQITRPGVDQIMAYRAYVDEHLLNLLGERGDDPELAQLVTLGLHHEQQHQELILTDIKHVLAANPLCPAYRDGSLSAVVSVAPLEFLPGSRELVDIGSEGADFCFDNERPRHRQWLEPHRLGDRLITNGEFLEFIRDGGYRTPELWLSDGWATVQAQGWDRPLYWNREYNSEFTLLGEQALDPSRPVCHVSYYEADAFARWAGARLPTEAEWETAVEQAGIEPVGQGGHSAFHPDTAQGSGLRQCFGDVWQWTSSPYVQYPGYRAPAGAIGEYNGKFMCNQMVLRGSSCVTPPGHARITYRNFFYPGDRWQFMGIRLAKDID
ncbi:ergothioneine biosynthesis protein EgtB [Ectothiorhodospira haloalkaliphila]|uniref:ergothioneine biosynthesis protein EgtB n=1 Tax=Ectothiorhodospira haloalkaliphila TaxID=421628 RepID=UPI001EE8E0A2|nr:ergothioneine biosynthesis protein EgtB [Ectothiorhodospira haloalkaliphila]